MTRCDELRETAKVVEVLEEAGVAVDDVSVAADGDDGPSIELTFRLPDEPLALPVFERGAAGRPTGTSSDETVNDTAASDPTETEPRDDAETSAESSDRPDGASDDRSVTAEDGSATATADADADSPPAESVQCPIDGCGETFGSDHGMKIHVAKSHGDDGDAPAHRDPDRLAAVYERHDTFEAMRDALEVDVTAQTVRRNMMKHGIHDPDAAERMGEQADRADDGGNLDEGDPHDSSADRSAESTSVGVGEAPVEQADEPSGEERTAATDGGAGTVPAGTGGLPTDDRTSGPDAGSSGDGPALGSDDDPEAGTATESALDALAADLDLPVSVSLGEFVEVVADARTLFDVQRALELDRPEAQSLLADLGLLEFVHGRVAEQERYCETPTEEVERRLRERIDAE